MAGLTVILWAIKWTETAMGFEVKTEGQECGDREVMVRKLLVY